MMAKVSENSTGSWSHIKERLLRKEGDLHNAVAFSDESAERNGLIIRGYFRAGQVLVDQCDKNTNEKHILIYPILFCYRHALELAMKDIICSYGHHYGVSDSEPDHRLWRVWQLCKSILAQIDVEGAADIISAVEKYIEVLDNLDERGEAFRFAEKKDGTLIPLPNILVDPLVIRAPMLDLERFFRGLDEHLRQLWSLGNETHED